MHHPIHKKNVITKAMHGGREVMIVPINSNMLGDTSDAYNSRLVMRNFYSAIHVVIRGLRSSEGPFMTFEASGTDDQS